MISTSRHSFVSQVVAYLQYNQLAPYADKSKAVADSLIKFYAGIKVNIPHWVLTT